MDRVRIIIADDYYCYYWVNFIENLIQIYSMDVRNQMRLQFFLKPSTVHTAQFGFSFGSRFFFPLLCGFHGLTHGIIDSNWFSWCKQSQRLG